MITTTIVARRRTVELPVISESCGTHTASASSQVRSCDNISCGCKRQQENTTRVLQTATAHRNTRVRKRPAYQCTCGWTPPASPGRPCISHPQGYSLRFRDQGALYGRLCKHSGGLRWNMGIPAARWHVELLLGFAPTCSNSTFPMTCCCVRPVLLYTSSRCCTLP